VTYASDNSHSENDDEEDELDKMVSNSEDVMRENKDLKAQIA
jgi:hypothetical protein